MSSIMPSGASALVEDVAAGNSGPAMADAGRTTGAAIKPQTASTLSKRNMVRRMLTTGILSHMLNRRKLKRDRVKAFTGP